MFAFALSFKARFIIPCKIVSNILFLRLISYEDEIIGVASEDFEVADQNFSVFFVHWRENKNATGLYIGYLQTSLTVTQGRQKCCTTFSMTLEGKGKVVPVLN
jgi:hypothetical protein